MQIDKIPRNMKRGQYKRRIRLVNCTVGSQLKENSRKMASHFSICFSLFILAYCVTYSSAAVTSWKEEFKMEIEAKMNKIETKNIQLEGKVTQLETQLEEKVTQLETQLELNVRTFHFLF